MQLPSYAATSRDNTPVAGTTCGNLTVPILLTDEFPNIPNNTNTITIDEAVAIEKNTRKQSESEQWFNERRGRITSSRFGDILKRKKVSEKFISSTAYGLAHESEAKTRYLQKFPGRHLHSCGLLVQPQIAFLGASPDGLVCDKGSTGVFEIKCPYSAREMSILDAAQQIKHFYVTKEGEQISISKKHNCYYQIQGQLMISGLSFCDFVLCTKVDLFIERVNRDKAFIDNMITSLHNFHTKYSQTITN